MTEEVVTDRSAYDLPFGRTITLRNVAHDSGLHMLRLTIREGRRFTILDLDAASAQTLGADLTAWADDKTQQT
jgi:Family of unknown function (DUF6967)